MKWLQRLFGTAPRPAQTKTQRPSPEEMRRRAKERREKALAHFPFEIHEIAGTDAMAKWRELKAANRGAPVILAGNDGLENLLEPFTPGALQSGFSAERPVEAILAAAEKIRFPDDLLAMRKADIAEYAMDEQEEPLGEWPDIRDASTIVSPGLTVASDILSGKPLDKVYVCVVPTDDWTTIPAYLRWGGWNENPGPEWHVAALRSWRDRYGVELVGLSFDVLNLTVARKPQTRDEAIALAREQYAYCGDIVDQGTETISTLARGLLDSDWWFFWWD